MYQHKSSSAVASSDVSSETPRFTLETAAVLSLLVQRQRGRRPTAGGAAPRLSPGAPAEIRLRNLQDFAKRLFGIQIDLGGLDADEVVKAEVFDGADSDGGLAEGVSSGAASARVRGRGNA